MLYRASGNDPNCRLCHLSSGAIYGQSLCPLDNVMLAVISAYPGTEEMKQGATLVPATYRGGTVNAGRYLQILLSMIFDRDSNFPAELKPFDSHVFKTNAIKCGPKGKVPKDNDVISCKPWLMNELNQLPKGIPLVLASKEAVKSLLGTKQGLYDSRERLWDINGHPAIVTLNPIEGERYTPKVLREDGQIQSHPLIVGSPPWLLVRDFQRAKELVLEYYHDRQQRA